MLEISWWAVLLIAWATGSIGFLLGAILSALLSLGNEEEEVAPVRPSALSVVGRMRRY
jgi:hypothetical protein